jgi:hypothetical protein
MRSHGVELLPTEKILNYDGSSFYTSSGRVIQADCAFICTGNMPNTQVRIFFFFEAPEILSDPNAVSQVQQRL